MSQHLKIADSHGVGAFLTLIFTLGSLSPAAGGELATVKLRNPVWTSKDNLRDPCVLKVAPDGYLVFYSRLAPTTNGWGDPRSWAMACAATKDLIRFENDHDVSPKGYAAPGDVVKWRGRWLLPYQSYAAKPTRLVFSESADLTSWSAPKPFLTAARHLPWNEQQRVSGPCPMVASNRARWSGEVGTARRQTLPYLRPGRD